MKKGSAFAWERGNTVYLHLPSLLDKKVSVGDLLLAALISSEEVTRLLPSGDPVLQQLQRVQQAGPLFLDIEEADRHFDKREIEKLVRTIRVYWHQHGFCIARSADPHRWVQATFDYQQPLLHWRGLLITCGWDLIGLQLRGLEWSVFWHLLSQGVTTVERVATDPTIFSQFPNFARPSVQRDIEMGRALRAPIDYNRSEASNILTRMRNRRIVVESSGFYGIVRPTWENGV